MKDTTTCEIRKRIAMLDVENPVSRLRVYVEPFGGPQTEHIIGRRDIGKNKKKSSKNNVS